MLNIVQYIGEKYLIFFHLFCSCIAHMLNESINEWIKNEKERKGHLWAVKDKSLNNTDTLVQVDSIQ